MEIQWDKKKENIGKRKRNERKTEISQRYIIVTPILTIPTLASTKNKNQHGNDDENFPS